MQYSKLWPLVVAFSFYSQAQTPEQQITQIKKTAKQAIQSIDANKVPTEIPENMKEKFRQAAQGQGDFALPNISDNSLSELSPEQRSQMKLAADKLKARTEEMKQKGWLDPFSEDAVNKQVENYRKSAQMLSEQSTSSLERALQKHVGLTEEQASHFSSDSNSSQSRQNEPNEKAIFISFSMSNNSIRKSIELASKEGAEVYLRGLHPDHKMINQTMVLLRDITKGITQPPIVRFNPTAFKKYDINSVPTILYREFDKYITAAGVTNFNWLKKEYNNLDESKELGVSGPVSQVLERDIIDVMKERMASYDWEAERKRTVETYWQRQSYSVLPRAKKTEEWLIDPTIKASKDISTPRGELIAKQGAVMNPLKGHGVGFTTIIFNATDIKQVEWVANSLNKINTVGQLMLITTEINKQKGWKHLEALQRQFGQQIFLMPKELASRFQLSGVPAIAKTDLKKSMLHVTQFNVNEEL